MNLQKKMWISLLLFLSAQSHAITINYGLVEESYPTSHRYFGEVPYAHAAQIGLQSESELRWEPVGVYYLTVEAIGKYEAKPEKYDRERYPVSLEGNFSVVRPILESVARDSLNVVAGGKIQMNGPQYNDNYRDLFVGAQLQQKVKTDYGFIHMKAMLGYVKYFYEVDDEPAWDQTKTAREYLSHSGGGRLMVIQADYRSGTNTLRLTYQEIDASDRLQGGRYQKKESGIMIEKAISAKSSCAIDFKIISHQYSPNALSHPDRMNATQLRCSRKF